MIETARGRTVAIVLLLAGQALLFPMYATQPVDPDAGVFADTAQFTGTPDEYLGSRVVAEGRVQQRTPMVIQVETTRGPYEITVVDSRLSPARGDKVRVYGELTGPGTVRSIHAFVVPQSSLWFTWGVSFLAGLWVLARLVRHWTIDRSRLGFYPRESPLRVRDLRFGRDEEGD